MKESLVEFLSVVLRSQEIVKETLAWWSIFAVIDILDKILETETDLHEVEKVLRSRKDLAFRYDCPTFRINSLQTFLRTESFISQLTLSESFCGHKTKVDLFMNTVDVCDPS